MRPTKRYTLLAGLLLSGGFSAWAAPAEVSDDQGWRAAALAKYDRNKDGRLSDAEREVMRKEVFAERRRPSSRGRGMMFPPEIVAKYDKDGDGSLDEAESRTAQEGLMRMFQDLQRKYDTNGNGNFEPAEVEKLQADAAAGQLEEVPKVFIQMLGMQGRRRPRPHGPPSAGPAEVDYRQLDKDGDGRLNAEELRAARASLKDSRPEESSPGPIRR